MQAAPLVVRTAVDDEEPEPLRFRFGLSALFGVVTVSAFLIFALVNAGESQVWLALATVPIIVAIAAPLVYLASRGCGRAVTYVVVFLLLGGLATGLIAGWVAYSIRSARTIHEKDDLRQLGGALQFRDQTGRAWQGSKPVQEVPRDAFLDRLLDGAADDDPPADASPD